ncbi:hypothetical protein [Psychromarinibacter sp. S121]|uniref:hypothetical protein n=1 Tax=Psychromarinibacter sp. S121 TaxID=3415127 RepID=UPI003C7A36CC
MNQLGQRLPRFKGTKMLAGIEAMDRTAASELGIFSVRLCDPLYHARPFRHLRPPRRAICGLLG